MKEIHSDDNQYLQTLKCLTKNLLIKTTKNAAETLFLFFFSFPVQLPHGQEFCEQSKSTNEQPKVTRFVQAIVATILQNFK